MRGLQVPKDVIEASANIVGKAKSVPISCVPCGGGDRLPFIG
jgi:hypothetical protein